MIINMKILQINSVCGYGSTGKIAMDIHNFLKLKEQESYIAYGREFSENNENTIKIGTKFDNYTHVILSRIFDKQGFGSEKATEKFIEKIKKIDPDIIHLHNIHGYYINVELLFNYLQNSNKPVVWTLHDCWPFTGHCAYFDYVDCDKWKSICEYCPQKKEYPSSIFKDNSKWNFQKKKDLFTSLNNITIVTPSIWLAKLVKQSFLNNYQVVLINNGIDLNVFQPTISNFREEYNVKDKFIILGVASVWDRRKGLIDFIRLSELLDENYKIVLVGLSQNQVKGLPDNIIGITRTNNVRDLAAIYSTADVFFNPTYEDNYPTTNLEALACGTPVITYDTGGSGESVFEDCGFVVEKGKLELVLDLIKELKNKSYPNISHKNVLSSIDKEYKINEYYDLYEQIIGDLKI